MILDDERSISRALSIVESVVDRAARLPDVVFRAELTDFCWIEFEDVLDDPFFNCLQTLAKQHGDREFFVACLDPDVRENYGHSGVASFSVSDPIAAYDEFFDADRVTRTISLRDIATRFGFVGEQRTWAFDADRDVELAIGGQIRPGCWPRIKGVRYHTFESMLEIASGPYRKQLPSDIRDAYERNYRARSWSISQFVEG